MSNINLKKTEKKRFALKFCQEIRTETRISNFNLKGGSGPQHLRLGGGYLGGDMFRIIYLRGDVFALYTGNLNLVGILGGGGGGGDLFRIIYLKGDMFRFLDRRFYSGQPTLHFVIVTYDFIYLRDHTQRTSGKIRDFQTPPLPPCPGLSETMNPLPPPGRPVHL